MGTAVIGALRVDLSLGTAGWDKGRAKIVSDADKLSARLKNIGAGVSSAGKAMTIGITAPFAALMSQAIPAAIESRQALGQVEAALKSMGPQAGRTSEQLQAAATELMHLSTFDDDEILRKVTANLLTFGNVAGEQFDRAQKAAVDLATRMGTDLQSATLMLGKALNSPAKGLAALRRVGIQFTKDQEKQITAMVKAGDTAGAQSVMLKELEAQFGGSAKAMRDATPGADVKNAWDDFQETVGELALDVLPKLTPILAGILEAFNSMPEGMQTVAVAGAAIAAALGPILMVLGPIISGIGTLIPIIAGWASSMGAAAAAAGGIGALLAPLLPIIAAVAAVVGAAYLVWQNWGTIGPMLQGFGQAVVDALGPSVVNLFNALKEAALALWNSAFVQGLMTAGKAILQFHLIVLKALGSALPGILSALGALFKGVFDMIAAALRFVVAILTGDWEGAWDAAKAFVRAFAEGVGGILGGLTQAVIGFFSSMVAGIRTWIGDRLEEIWERVRAGIDKVKGFFRGLWDAVVGHSYIPDMVDQIGAHMGRLDAEMVAPVQKATKGAGDAMKKMADDANAAAVKSFESMKAMRDDMKALLERLFPEAAAFKQYMAELKLLSDHHREVGLTAEQAQEAIRRLREEDLAPREGLSESITDAKAPWDHWRKPDHSATDPMDQYEEWVDRFTNEKLPDLSKSSMDHTAKVVESFAGMAEGIIGAMRGVTDAFKNGDIWDKLTSIVQLVGQAVQTYMQIKGGGGAGGGGFGGLFGGGASGGVMSYGGTRAYGGPVVPGKAYRVGENGRGEWFTPEQRGRISPGSSPPSGGNTYNFSGNLMTEEFWNRIRDMDDAAAMRGGAAGMDLTVKHYNKRAARALGGRR